MLGNRAKQVEDQSAVMVELASMRQALMQRKQMMEAEIARAEAMRDRD